MPSAVAMQHSTYPIVMRVLVCTEAREDSHGEQSGQTLARRTLVGGAGVLIWNGAAETHEYASRHHSRLGISSGCDLDLDCLEQTTELTVLLMSFP